MTPSYRVSVTPVASAASLDGGEIAYAGVLTVSRPGIAADRAVSAYLNRNGRRFSPKGEVIKVIVERIA